MLSLIKILNLQVVLFAALLFFIGYWLAPTAYFKRIRWLTAYPFFIIQLIDKYFKKDWHPIKIFVTIFLLNTLSLFINLLSAWGVFLPLLFIIYLGINIGIIMYHSLNGNYYFVSLLNPVALLELPAAWISIAMAIQFSLVRFFDVDFIPQVSFSEYVYYFFVAVVPILFTAGIIETILMVIARRQEPED